MALAVETKALTKAYGSFVAVDKLSLSVREGEIFGFLGPNGAGKTTTLLMLLGLTQSTGGSARLCGYDAFRQSRQVRRITGYLPETVGFYDDLSAEENLLYTARLNDLGEAEARGRIGLALAKVGLEEVARKKVGQFSRGMRQRLGIADVLIKQPKIVFLDEPTVGLDPEGMSQLLNIVTALSREEGFTIFLSSHQLYQVQKICDRVGILSKGHLVALGPVAELGRQVLGHDMTTIELELQGESVELAGQLRQLRGVRDIERSGNTLVLRCEGDPRLEVSQVIWESRCPVLEMRSRGMGLEEIYLKYFQQGD